MILSSFYYFLSVSLLLSNEGILNVSDTNLFTDCVNMNEKNLLSG